MIRRGYAQPFAIAAALALGLVAAACGGRSANNTIQGARGTSGTAEIVGQPITVSGCLQQRDGGDHYIVTNIHTTPVGTTGTVQSTQKARNELEREETRAAEHSYRLSGQDAALKNMIGHEIRVTGTIAELSDLESPATPALVPGEPGATGTAGTLGRAPEPIVPNDLTKIDVTSVDDVAVSCD
jgi:hypothetical protein